MKKLAALALSGALISTAAFAGSPPDGTVTINATVIGSCEWINNNSALINFDIDLINQTTSGNTSGNLVFNCTQGTQGTISWTSSNGNKLVNTTDNTKFIDYTLTVDLSGSTSANNISSGHSFTDTNGTGQGNEETLTFTINPDLANAGNLPTGTYSDTITVTITVN